jgi:hypothetical protein
MADFFARFSSLLDWAAAHFVTVLAKESNMSVPASTELDIFTSGMLEFSVSSDTSAFLATFDEPAPSLCGMA